VYIGADRAFEYENSCPYRLTDNTRSKLMEEIDTEEFKAAPYEKRIILNDLEDFFRNNEIDVCDSEDVAKVKMRFASDCMDAEMALDDFVTFCHVVPRLPDPDTKNFLPGGEGLGIEVGMSREQIIERLKSVRGSNAVADMAFHAYRDLGQTEAEPFILAAVERNPVAIAATDGRDTVEVMKKIEEMPSESIYDEPGRLAQPDEVWNYGRGDGVEKALLLAVLLRRRNPEAGIVIKLFPGVAILKMGDEEFSFVSSKDLPEQEWEIPV
jgi:hypothetical protein